jgi:His-Xaa-Ser system protein HxsD
MKEKKNNVFLIKGAFSESSVRHASALAFNYSKDFPSIVFDKDEEQWALIFEEIPMADDLAQLNKVLNDFRIRELIDKDTRGVRQRIVARALQNVYQNDKT